MTKRKIPPRIPYRFTLDDRERIKADIRVHLLRFAEREYPDPDAIPYRPTFYLRGDGRVVREVEGNGNHVLFPLRVDVDKRKVETAVKDLFRGDDITGKTLRESIVEAIQAAKSKRQKWERFWRRHMKLDDMLMYARGLFGPGWLHGQALFNVLSVDEESKVRWEKNLRGRRIDEFRVTPDTAAKVMEELMWELFKEAITSEALKKRFG